MAAEKGLAQSLIYELAARSPRRHQHNSGSAFRFVAQKRLVHAAGSSSAPRISGASLRAVEMKQQAVGPSPNSGASERRFRLPPISAELVMESERAAW